MPIYFLIANIPGINKFKSPDRYHGKFPHDCIAKRIQLHPEMLAE